MVCLILKPFAISLLAFSLSALSRANAAVPPLSETKPVSASSISILEHATKEALVMPIGNRMQVLVGQGPQGYRNLISIMFNEKYTMEMRWRAVQAVAMIGGEESQPELESAIKRPEWFMKNAALVAMTNVSRPAAIRWAREMVSDRALVVRAAAVETLVDLKDASSAPLLWEKLYSKENFRGGQSLFIRRRIVEALASLEAPGRESKFIEILTDKDQALHPVAIAALERLTQQRLGQDKDPLSFKRERWQQWWKKSARTKL